MRNGKFERLAQITTLVGFVLAVLMYVPRLTPYLTIIRVLFVVSEIVAFIPVALLVFANARRNLRENRSWMMLCYGNIAVLAISLFSQPKSLWSLVSIVLGIAFVFPLRRILSTFK